MNRPRGCIFSDFDGNDRWDLADTAGMQVCFGLSSISPGWLDACLCLFDFDDMGTLDLNDFAAFCEAITGP